MTEAARTASWRPALDEPEPLRLAYFVRAVSPGEFHYPPADGGRLPPTKRAVGETGGWSSGHERARRRGASALVSGGERSCGVVRLDRWVNATSCRPSPADLGGGSGARRPLLRAFTVEDGIWRCGGARPRDALPRPATGVRGPPLLRTRGRLLALAGRGAVPAERAAGLGGSTLTMQVARLLEAAAQANWPANCGRCGGVGAERELSKDESSPTCSWRQWA